jgi:hypothetical protein
MRAARWAISLLAFALLPAAYAVGCVDGQTPDCSDAATGCGPDLDGSLDGRGDGPSEAADTGLDVQPDANADAEAGPDADLDASDGG